MEFDASKAPTPLVVGTRFQMFAFGDVEHTDMTFTQPPFIEQGIENRVQLRVDASELCVCVKGIYRPIQSAIRDIFMVMRNPNRSMGTVTVVNRDMTYNKRLTDSHAVPWLNAFNAQDNERALTIYVDASMFDDKACIHGLVDEDKWRGGGFF